MLRSIFLYLLTTICFFRLEAQVQPAIFAGPQTTSVHYTIHNANQPAAFKYGAMAGVGLKVSFENQLYFFPAVYYSLKGYKVTLNDPAFPPSELARNNDTRIHTIELAPLLQFDFSKKASHGFLRVGPSLDVAFSGTEKFQTIDNKTITHNMVFAYTEYGRITASGIFHLGYQFPSGFFAFAHYAHGLGSMNNADGGPKITHRIIGISFGLLLQNNPNIIDTRNKE